MPDLLDSRIDNLNLERRANHPKTIVQPSWLLQKGRRLSMAG